MKQVFMTIRGSVWPMALMGVVFAFFGIIGLVTPLREKASLSGIPTPVLSVIVLLGVVWIWGSVVWTLIQRDK